MRFALVKFPTICWRVNGQENLERRWHLGTGVSDVTAFFTYDTNRNGHRSRASEAKAHRNKESENAEIAAPKISTSLSVG